MDFRDHTDFSRPLEFLTLSDAEFEVKAREIRYRCGNRLRYTEVLALLRAASFEASLLRKLSWVDDAYFDALPGRLQPRFQRMEDDALRLLGALVRIRKPSAPGTAPLVEIAAAPLKGVSRYDP